MDFFWRDFFKFIVLDVIVVFAVASFVSHDTTESLRSIPCEGMARALFWLGSGHLFVAVVLVVGTGIFRRKVSASYQRLRGDESALVDRMSMVMLLPVGVIGYFALAAGVIFKSSISGHLTATGGLEVEAWASLLIGMGCWCLLQALAAIAIRRGMEFPQGAFAAAAVPSLLPLVSDAFDVAKDLCFAAIAMEDSDDNVKALGKVSCAFAILARCYMLAIQDGRYELRDTYLGVFSASADARKSDIGQGRGVCVRGVEASVQTMFEKCTPKHIFLIFLSDAPQIVLAVVFCITSSKASPWVVYLNIVMPVTRICLAKVLYRCFLRWAYFLKVITQPVYMELLSEARHEWIVGHLRSGVKMHGATNMICNTLPAHLGIVDCEAVTALIKAMIESIRMYTDELAAVQASQYIADSKVLGIGADAAAGFAEALKAHPTTTSKEVLNTVSLHLMGIFKADYRMEKFQRVDSDCTLLDLRGTRNIGHRGAEVLAEALKVNFTIAELHLWTNKLQDDDVVALAKALEVNSSLKELHLSSNLIRSRGGAALAEALASNSTLNILSLSHNDLRDEGAAALSKALDASSLFELHLSTNSIGAQGAIALAESLKDPQSVGDADELPRESVARSLTFLDLDRNFVGDEGASALARALKVNSSLRTLGLCENGFGNVGAAALAEALKVNRSLEAVMVWGNKFGTVGGKALRSAKTVMESRGARLIGVN